MSKKKKLQNHSFLKNRVIKKLLINYNNMKNKSHDQLYLKSTSKRLKSWSTNMTHNIILHLFKNSKPLIFAHMLVEQKVCFCRHTCWAYLSHLYQLAINQSLSTEKSKQGGTLLCRSCPGGGETDGRKMRLGQSGGGGQRHRNVVIFAQGALTGIAHRVSTHHHTTIICCLHIF